MKNALFSVAKTAEPPFRTPLQQSVQAWRQLLPELPNRLERAAVQQDQSVAARANQLAPRNR